MTVGVSPGSLRKISIIAFGLLLAACHSSPPRTPSMGVAYVGPLAVNLRSDIPVQSPTVTTVKHGDRVEILLRHRTSSFLKVRAPNGREGWTEERQLLGADDMASLKALAKHADAMPSQGRAVTDTDLRVRIQPATNAPSFLTLKENDKVDVLTHLRRPRTDLVRKPLVTPPPKKAKATKKPGKQGQVPPPPPPVPPSPPANWLELSKTDEPPEETPPDPGPPVPTDDWSLVRTPDGQSGWVLTRRLRMAIPDEVAQYAEGHRIVSYFSLGAVRDGDQQKDIWLWTTIGDGVRPYDFDSLRVFAWSSHRHRYETQFIERNLIGYSPVELQKVHYSSGKGKAGQESDEYGGFSVCVEKKDGQRYRQQYAVMGNLIRFAGEEPCVVPPPVDFNNPAAAPVVPAPTPGAPAPQESLWQRVKRRLKSLRGSK
jgi:SH3-like domain-containing protein